MLVFPALRWHCQVRSTREEGDSSTGTGGASQALSTQILPKRSSWEQLLSGAQCPSDPREPKPKPQRLSPLAASGSSSLQGPWPRVPAACRSREDSCGSFGAGRGYLQPGSRSQTLKAWLLSQCCWDIPNSSLPVEGTSCYPIPISLPLLHFQLRGLQHVLPTPPNLSRAASRDLARVWKSCSPFQGYLLPGKAPPSHLLPLLERAHQLSPSWATHPSGLSTVCLLQHSQPDPKSITHP